MTIEELKKEANKELDEGERIEANPIGYTPYSVVDNYIDKTAQAIKERAIEVVENMKWKGEPPEEASDITWAVHTHHNQTLEELAQALNNL